MNTSPRPLSVGDVIHGHAHGALGNDHHTCARIEQVGPDWIVARDQPTNPPVFAAGRQQLALLQHARDEPCPNACARVSPGPPLTTWTPSR